jgi:hypothetical protein
MGGYSQAARCSKQISRRADESGFVICVRGHFAEIFGSEDERLHRPRY